MHYALRVLIVLVILGVAGCAQKRATRAPAAPKTTAWLSTAGNRIVDSRGQIWMGRGANLHDTRSCSACTFDPPGAALVREVKRRADTLVDDWGANLVRLNLESHSQTLGVNQNLRHYGGVLDDPGYLAEVVEIVRHIGEKPGVYVLLSLWEEPSFDQELAIPTSRTQQIWRLLAAVFARDAHVIYGLANEPRNQDGMQDARVWQAMNDAVTAIREVEQRAGAKPHLIAVQGTRAYGRDLAYYLDHPITAGSGANIIYETHVYNPQSDFERLVLNPAKTLPVIIGEFGPVTGLNSGEMSLKDCAALMNLAEQQRIPYTAWTFHMRCPPNLLEDPNPLSCGVGMPLKPTAWGQLVRSRLRGARK